MSEGRGPRNLPRPNASIAVAGLGEAGRRAVEASRERRDRNDADRTVVTAAEDAPVGGATLVAVGSDAATDDVVEGLADLAAAAPLTVVVTAADDEDRVDGLRLDRLRRVVDAVVVCPGGDAGLADALGRLVRLLDTRSVVNLDVADLVTVLDRGDAAAFAHGEGDARAAAETAFESVPAGLSVESAPAVLVHVVGTSTTSVEAAGAVVDAVRERVGVDAHLIWGTAIADGGGDGLELELVAGGVEFRRDPGDPCPRCGRPLVGYSLGERSAVVCEGCGFSGNAVRLR